MPFCPCASLTRKPNDDTMDGDDLFTKLSNMHNTTLLIFMCDAALLTRKF